MECDTRVRAVLIDSGSATYEQLAPAMARSGIALRHATSPAGALHMAQVDRPDVALINLTMAGRLGDFSFSLLRLDGSTASIPVVFLIDPLRWGRRANDASADALVPAPWREERVFAAVHRVVRRNLAGSRSMQRSGEVYAEV